MSPTLRKFTEETSGIVNEYLGKNGPQLAAAISYYALFSLFPLILAFTLGMSFFLQEDTIEDVAKRIATQVPVSQEAVSNVLNDTLESRGIAGALGAVGLFWAGSTVFSAIRKGVNATWGITRPRPFLRERTIDLSLMLAAAILMLVSIFSTAALSQLRELVDLITRETETQINADLFWERVGTLVAAALSFIVFMGVYWVLPNTRVSFLEALVGASIATFVFELVKNVFVWYVLNSSIYSTIYGSIGGVVALLTWVYASANILLFGSLLTYRFATYRATRIGSIHDIVEAEMARSALQPVGRE